MRIVLLGFNKCGTTSFHKMFIANGLNSRHHGSNNTKKNLAMILHKNFHLGGNLYNGIDFDCIMDISYLSETIHIEAQFYYKEMYESEPENYYILNTRPMDKWINSRIRHGGGDFINRFGNFYVERNLSQIKKLWAQQWESLHTGVMDFFNAKAADGLKVNFLKFDIEKDNPMLIKTFLEPDFSWLDIAHWGKHNATKKI